MKEEIGGGEEEEVDRAWGGEMSMCSLKATAWKRNVEVDQKRAHWSIEEWAILRVEWELGREQGADVIMVEGRGRITETTC